MIGSKLAHYEITAHLGSGGMGDVYQATDTKLGRSVAIKFLPEAFSHDSERVARFQREAEVLAQLNHPNIAVIYGLEESNSKALVLELVEGPTVGERIAQGPIPVEETLQIAKQIADALEYAHEHAVIHRDLKPSNIKLKPDGTVKVLDFGLAKALNEDARSPVTSNSPTLSLAATQVGVILGTAGYMSPEQAKGKEVDRRADIWAFGVVVYEMLTGRQMFTGETVSETMAAVMMKGPDWDTLPKNTPPRLRELLQQCLVKEPRNRVRDIGDVRITIEDTIAHAGTELMAAEVPATLSPQRMAQPRLLWAALVFVTLIALLLAGVLIYKYRTPAESSIVRFSIPAPDKAIFAAATPYGLSSYTAGSISPDGRKLAFTARQQAGPETLWVRALDNLTAQPLAGTEGAALPFWSPDSRSIGFFAEGKLKKINIEGGPPLTLCDAPAGRGGTWNQDGIIVFAPTPTSVLNRVSSAGGQSVAVTQVAEQLTHRFPSFLPDGKHFFYFAPGSSEVLIGSLGLTLGQHLLAADSPAVYARPGYILFVRQGTLLAQPFDAQKLQLSGEAVPIAEQIPFEGNGMAYSVSANGVLIYRAGLTASRMQLTWIDRTGKLIESIATPGPYMGPDLSPDGKRVAVFRHDGSGNGGDVWVVETSGGKTSRLTFDASQENSSPLWSPDGTHIAFASRRNGKWGIYQKLSSGTGNEELLFESEALKKLMSWSADGKFILYEQLGVKTGNDVWALPLMGDKKPFAVLQSAFNEGQPQISPDTKWIVYDSSETGTRQVYVQSFPPGSGKWQISSDGGQWARWRRDGKELFYMDTSNKLFAVGINVSGSTFESSVPRPLFDSGYVNTNFGYSGSWNPYAVSPDGQQFLIPRPETNLTGNPSNTPITVVLNWTAALNKK